LKIYLSGIHHYSGKRAHKYNIDAIEGKYKIQVLESFYYIQPWMAEYIKKYWDFIIDSGAYTFMTGQKDGGGNDWDDYTEKYANFINEHNIKSFFELDIDNVVGLKEVERLRKRLENITCKQSIPVWHKSRGKDYFISMCKDYKYVAIGGIVNREIKKHEHKFFSWFIDKAHENECKIHGLGYTNLSGLKIYKFDSVDSTSWLFGHMSTPPYRYMFTGNDIIKKHKKGFKAITKKVSLHNYKEWVKFQRYAMENL
jgi:hypothetical protein